MVAIKIKQTGPKAGERRPCLLRLETHQALAAIASDKVEDLATAQAANVDAPAEPAAAVDAAVAQAPIVVSGSDPAGAAAPEAVEGPSQ